MDKLPFGARNKGIDLNTIIRNSKIKPSEINFNKIPEPFRINVIKALEKNPNKRYKTTNELLKAVNKKPTFITYGVSFFYYLRKYFKHELIEIK